MTSFYFFFFLVLVLLVLFVVCYRWLLWNFISWEHLADTDLSPLIPCPAVSVVVVCENEGDDMEGNLPKLLEQLGIDVEVVVVNAASTDMTDDALKRLKIQYPHMRQTYVPMSNSNLNVWEFGCMLGARAARYDWVLFVPPSFTPSSEIWLLDLLRYADQKTKAVIDYGHVGEQNVRESWLSWMRRYVWMVFTAIQGRSVTTAGGSLLIRKNWLLDRTDATARGECVYLCRRFNPLRRVTLRVHNLCPSISAPW